MCWLLVVIAISNVAYDALGAADHHAVRAHVFNATALLAAGLIGALTWKYGVYGAFGGMFAAQFCIGGSLWAVLGILTRGGRAGLRLPAASGAPVIERAKG
jgi:hypothetical protein